MKYLSGRFSTLFPAGETRTNLAALLRYFVFLVAMISAYAVLFHVIMVRVEGQQHSWITGFYWTLVVMSTLGFGDITFTTDMGRLFSIIVLMSGVRHRLTDRSQRGRDGRQRHADDADDGGFGAADREQAVDARQRRPARALRGGVAFERG